MSYNSSGVYTRVDNSFSNPVTGTTISPTDADSYFDDIDAALNAYRGTSTTSLAIGTGSKAFTTQTGKLFTVGRFVVATSDADPANYMFGQVTAYSGTTLTVNVIGTGGTGTLADWTIVLSGARGGAGPIAGFRQLYDSATTDADPGAGNFRLNHATPSSASEGYFDNTDTGGGTVSSIIDKWDDSTGTTKGFLRIEKESDSSVWAEFTVTGSVTDGTGYRKVTLSSGSSNGTFTAGDAFRIAFSRAGDKGADGAGSGDVVGPASSTDNAFARFDSTTGKLIKDSGVTADDSNNVAGMATLTLPNTGLHLLDTNASHDLIIAPGSNLTADRTLTITTGDSDRTLTLSADATLTGSPIEQGKHTIWIPASAMLSATTSGPASAQFESGTNDRNFKVLDFDASADEHAHFCVAFPKGWNEGTVTFQVFWMSSATDTDGVAWGLEGSAVSDNETTDGSWGTAVVVTDDAQSNASEVYVTSESSAVTIGGTPAEGDIVFFRLFRDVSDANDDMTEDARLIGVKIFYTINASTDA